jgi:hypothetical protein
MYRTAFRVAGAPMTTVASLPQLLSLKAKKKEDFDINEDGIVNITAHFAVH